MSSLPYTTLSRSHQRVAAGEVTGDRLLQHTGPGRAAAVDPGIEEAAIGSDRHPAIHPQRGVRARQSHGDDPVRGPLERSEEHTSELQSRGHLVCRLLLEK